ncbi:nitronate monooxygenase [Thalassomonas sp. RHCl1]|uniref:NAD(P)H-dependent flavin oxidoreductase n=1 Tax=Thalassomonas sp. RHCl1 TaxID=2995320 RepID=UPI00248D37A2|nr:nitronate monooxygenase [Thalassomonas sp. RHCl1]
MNLCHTLGITKPIIQAPMAGVQNWELAVAVSEAGGLGSIPCGMLTKEQILSEVNNFRDRSEKPYNLNFFCHVMPAIDHQALKTWEQTLKKYYDSLSVNPPEKISGLRVPFDSSVADILEPYKPPVMSFHFGLPPADLVARIKSWGTVVVSSATTKDEGIWLQENGADVVIAQGSEAGGHRAMFMTSDPSTQVSTSELLACLKKALSVPIVAAGGIAASSDIKALLKQGASGVQIGTSYLLCDEAKTSDIHRDAIKSKNSTTALTNIFSGRLARGISNELMRDLNYISDKAPEFPYASITLAPLRAKAESQNQADFSPLWAGTNRSGCREISATKLTHDLWAGCL